MKKFSLKLNHYLFIAICILFVSYILSFKAQDKSHDKRKLIKTEIINEKNKYAIQSFKILQDDNELTIARLDDIWVAVQKGSSNYIPCDLKLVNNFINDFTSLRNMYKLSDSINPNNNNFGFFDRNSTKITYSLENGQTYELLFGKQDFSFSARYFMSGKSAVVYEMDNTLDKYLTASIQVWSDPYLLSRTILQQVTSKDIQRIHVSILENGSFITKTLDPSDKDYAYKAEKLSEYRHGGFAIKTTENENVEFKLKFEYGNKWEAELSFYDTQDQDNDYNVVAEYFIPQINKRYKFSTKISAWTYNNIKTMVL